MSAQSAVFLVAGMGAVIAIVMYISVADAIGKLYDKIAELQDDIEQIEDKL